MDGQAIFLEALAKGTLYVAVLAAIGIVTTRYLTARALGTTDSLTRGAIDRRLSQLAVLVAILALASLATRAVAHTAVAFGADAWSWENLRVVTIESRWGQGWRMQAIAASAALGGAMATRAHVSAGWMVFSLTILALCATIPLLGHAAGSSWRVTLHIGHLIAAGAWLGSLAVLTLVIARTAPPAVLDASVRRFSPLALTAATAVAVSGAIAAAVYLGAFANVLGAPYGRMLLVKLAFVAGVGIFGRLNWRRVQAGDAPRPRLMLAELACAAAVVVATTVLTETEHPE